MAMLEGVDSTKELLEAHEAHLWNHALNYINSMSLKCAIQLGIADVIHKHGQPMTLSELADALLINKAKSDGLFRLMRILVHFKIFATVKDEEVEEEAYCLTLTSRLLLRDDPFSSVPLLLLWLDPALVDAFHHTDEWFRNEDSNSFVTKHGKDMWENASVDQRWNQVYNEAMACESRILAHNEKWKHVFDGVKTMVDVAGGTGTFTRAISRAFPNMECTVLDLPHVVNGLKGSENLSYVSGNMFEFIPHAHAVFLKRILHDWGDEDCVKILKKCKEAISPNGGKVIIVETVVGDCEEDEEGSRHQLLLDMLMVISNSGKERTEKEWSQLFLSAGFSTYNIKPLLGLRCVIEVFP